VGGPHFGKKSCAHATAGESASSTPRAQHQDRRLTLLLLSPCVVSTTSRAARPAWMGNVPHSTARAPHCGKTPQYALFGPQ
jgi:hypothetical protein